MSIRIAGREYAGKKRYVAGTHRTRTPQQTLDDYQRFMKPLGITRLANITGLDCIGVPVYLAVRPASRGLATSQGKGIDVASAKASALMETIESWHAEHIDRPLRHESARALRRSREVIDVTTLPLSIGASLEPELPLLWIEGWDLLREQAVWVPHETASTNFVMPRDHLPHFVQSSNGLASGNHLLEAIVHALCEVIERDAWSLWELGNQAEAKRTQIDLASIRDPLCAELLARIARADIGAALWDITSDVGIPAYKCTIYERDDRPHWRRVGTSGGFGCHLAPEVAAMRAISEAIQSRLTTIAGSRDDMFEAYDSLATEPEVLKVMVDELTTPPPTAAFSARRSRATETFEGDLEVLLSALRAVGLDSAIVIDLSKDEIGIPVVKVLVPGLEARLPSVQPGARTRRRREALAREGKAR